MKAQAGFQQHRDRRPEARAKISPTTDTADLSDRQRQVLECLKDAGTELTARQLQARTALSASVIEDTLASLVELQLVARLNTVIPSYSRRRGPDPPIHAE